MFTGVVRAGILYLVIIAGVRLMGKRQVGELEPSELVLSLIIADLASVPMQDYGIPLLTGVAPILTLLALTMVLSVGTMKSRRLRALLCGRPSMVIRNGQLETDPPRVLVSDGEILEGNLRALGRDRNWLNKQLKGAGCAGTETVFLLLSNGSDPPYIVEKEGEP